MKIKTLEKNENGRDFVCGDLHGSFSCLERFLENVKFDVSKDRLISVGDLVDRGPENEKCLSLLYEPWFFATKGNHEQLMEDFFYDDISPVNYWFNNGGLWGRQHIKGHSDESMAVRDCVEHRVKNLPLLITVNMQNGKKFHVIHAELYSYGAGAITDETLADEIEFSKVSEIETYDGFSVIWGRFIFLDFYRQTLDDLNIEKIKKRHLLNKIKFFFNENLSHIYSGHTIVKRPVQFLGQTNLDTMAYGSYDNYPKEWAGLSIVEPLSNKFWFSNDREFKEIEPIILT
jgi:serine/threonine protein phosphatase 1